jgi:hypothetical protein
MTENDVSIYTRSACTLLGLYLDASDFEAVAEHLGRNLKISNLLGEVMLEPELEPAGTYSPAPFVAATGRPA